MAHHHTPAPWTVKQTHAPYSGLMLNEFAVYAENGELIATLPTRRSPRNEDDARLIGTAPLLLMALETCLADLERLAREALPDALRERLASLQDARHIIALATGIERHKPAAKAPASPTVPRFTVAEIKAYEAGAKEEQLALHVAVRAILDGEDSGAGVAPEPWETLRRRLLALKERASPQEP